MLMLGISFWLLLSCLDFRLFKKEERNKNQSQLSSTRKMEIQPQQHGSYANSGTIAAQNQSSSVAEKLTSQTRRSGSLIDLEKPSITSKQSSFLSEPLQLAIVSQQSILPVAPKEKLIQLPEQSVFDHNYRIKSFQSEYSTVHEWYSNQNQIPHDSVLSKGVRGIRLQNGDKLHVNYKQPNFHKKGYWNCINDKSMMTGRNKFLETTNYHRQHSRSMNHCHPATLPQRRGFHSRQLCRYHAQGRCYYGEYCKFLHGVREGAHSGGKEKLEVK